MSHYFGVNLLMLGFFGHVYASARQQGITRSSDHARARESSVFQCARSSRAVTDNNKAESNNRCHNNITLRHKASSATVGLELQASASCFANNEAGESYRYT